jgi:hypothetical protein
MRLVNNKRTVIEFTYESYETVRGQIDDNTFKFRLRNPICFPHSTYAAGDIVFVSKNKRDGLRTLMVNATSELDDDTHIAVFTFHFRGDGTSGPYFQLIGTGLNFNSDQVVFGSAKGFQDFVRDHPDTPVTCRFGARKYSATYKHDLPLPAHNSRCLYACRLLFANENRTLDVFFYQK